jgi:predicted RNA-binding Zn-ribbon protein involved in translation (DUF1610 family)
MPEFQPASSAHDSAIESRCCPNCGRHLMLPKFADAGFAHRTFECPKCGRVQAMGASVDPMNSEMLGWLASELRPPT